MKSEVTVAACDGRCRSYGDCFGEIHRVEVFERSGKSWGAFHYCVKAIQTDEENGYRVERLNEPEVMDGK